MPSHQPNSRLAKIHRSYAADELARLFGKHKNTIYQWRKEGLRPCTGKRPYLYNGRDVREFLEARHKKNKRPLALTEIYCVRCRAPRTPAGKMADYRPDLPTSGMLEAICPNCSSMIYRRVNIDQLDEIRGEVEIAVAQAHSRLSDCSRARLNSDFNQGAMTHEKLQL